MHLDQPGDHLALALTHGWHIDFPIILGDSEFLASPEVRGDFGAMDDILARKTGDVRARTSDIFSLNDGSLHPLPGQRPSDVFTSFAAAQHEEIVFVRCIHGFNCWWIGSLSHARGEDRNFGETRPFRERCHVPAKHWLADVSDELESPL